MSAVQALHPQPVQALPRYKRTDKDTEPVDETEVKFCSWKADSKLNSALSFPLLSAPQTPLLDSPGTCHAMLWAGLHFT